MPCCLPSKRDPKTPLHLFETKDPEEQYLRWARHLRDNAGSGALLDMANDVLSVKSAIIMAKKADTALNP